MAPAKRGRIASVVWPIAVTLMELQVPIQASKGAAASRAAQIHRDSPIARRVIISVPPVQREHRGRVWGQMDTNASPQGSGQHGLILVVAASPGVQSAPLFQPAYAGEYARNMPLHSCAGLRKNAVSEQLIQLIAPRKLHVPRIAGYVVIALALPLEGLAAPIAIVVTTAAI
jgi:hypothetical protein